MLTRYYIKKKLVKENKKRKQVRALKTFKMAMLPLMAHIQYNLILSQHGVSPAIKALKIAELAVNTAKSIVEINNNKFEHGATKTIQNLQTGEQILPREIRCNSEANLSTFQIQCTDRIHQVQEGLRLLARLKSLNTQS